MDEQYQASIFVNSLSVVKQTPSRQILAEIILRLKAATVEIKKEKEMTINI